MDSDESVMIDGHEEVEAFFTEKSDDEVDNWAPKFGMQDDRFVDVLTGPRSTPPCVE